LDSSTTDEKSLGKKQKPELRQNRGVENRKNRGRSVTRYDAQGGEAGVIILDEQSGNPDVGAGEVRSFQKHLEYDAKKERPTGAIFPLICHP